MTVAEWDALAWWQQQMYLDGFEGEGLVKSADDDDSTLVSEEVHQSGGTTIVDRQHTAIFSGLPGEMSAFGIPERSL